jgi:hypothetical protein
MKLSIFILFLIERILANSLDLFSLSPDLSYAYQFKYDPYFNSVNETNYLNAISYCENIFGGNIFKCDTLDEWNFIKKTLTNLYKKTKYFLIMSGIEIAPNENFTTIQWHDGTPIDQFKFNITFSILPTGTVNYTRTLHFHPDGSIHDAMGSASGVICKRKNKFNLLNNGFIGSTELVELKRNYTLTAIECGILCTRQNKQTGKMCVEYQFYNSTCWFKNTNSTQNPVQTNIDNNYFKIY